MRDFVGNEDTGLADAIIAVGKRPLPVDDLTQLLREQATEITYIGKRLGRSS
jgi:hypothetical protein